MIGPSNIVSVDDKFLALSLLLFHSNVEILQEVRSVRERERDIERDREELLRLGEKERKSKSGYLTRNIVFSVHWKPSGRRGNSTV